MDLLYAFFFGGGVAAFVYSKMGRRLGYGNSQNVWTVVGMAFLISAIFFYTIIAFALNIH